MGSRTHIGQVLAGLLIESICYLGRDWWQQLNPFTMDMRSVQELDDVAHQAKAQTGDSSPLIFVCIVHNSYHQALKGVSLWPLGLKLLRGFTGH